MPSSFVNGMKGDPYNGDYENNRGFEKYTEQSNKYNSANYNTGNTNNNFDSVGALQDDAGYDGKAENGKGGEAEKPAYLGPPVNYNDTFYGKGDKPGILIDSEDEIKKTVDDYVYKPGGFVIDSNINEELEFQLPDYGYDRHLMDIRNWQKQLVSFGAEPGWFFFKVFFNFHTNYGLIGGLLDTISRTSNNSNTNAEEDEEMLEAWRENLALDPFLSPRTIDMAAKVTANKEENKTSPKIQSANTAYGYLSKVCTLHKYERIYDRMLALIKFAGTLKDITLRTPWVFRSISGLNSINQTYTQDLDKEKSFTIGLAEETLDQRIGTLIDLYKFAAFDQINCKEIIPANLRKFETTIMVYHMPLKYMHTKLVVGKDAAIDGNGIINAASTTTSSSSGDGGFDNMMSFKMYTFLNCEINTETLGEYYPDDFSNESPFQVGKNNLKINYDRVYEHRMNEWNEMFFGSDGFYYNNDFDIANKEYENNINHLDEYDKSRFRHKMKAMSTHKDANNTFCIAEYTDLILGKYYGMGYHIRISDRLGVGDLVRGIQGQWNDFSGRINGIRERWAEDSRRLATTHPGPEATVRH